MKGQFPLKKLNPSVVPGDIRNTEPRVSPEAINRSTPSGLLEKQFHYYSFCDYSVSGNQQILRISDNITDS